MEISSISSAIGGPSLNAVRVIPICNLELVLYHINSEGLKTSKTTGVLKEEHDLRLKEFKQAHKAKTAERYIEMQTTAVQSRLSVSLEKNIDRNCWKF